MSTASYKNDTALLAAHIKSWARELGFDQCAITGVDLSEDETHLFNWLKSGMHGSMHYMERHGTRRSRPDELEPGTVRVISVSLNYLSRKSTPPSEVLDVAGVAYVSRYALGRDYHKLMRQRLQKLASRIESQHGDFQYRAFVDSAPVLEKALARNAGLGWIGKHSNLLTRKGSWFFLGELYTNLPLPVDAPAEQSHCGTCRQCLDDCPTQAIVAPYRVDARKCISYLTIENRGEIPTEYRKAMGNRIYGCDDCQLVCPWNRFSPYTTLNDFDPRNGLDHATLVSLFGWTEQEFMGRLQGSPIRRIGYVCWLRNIAVALGNTPTSPSVVSALKQRINHDSTLVTDHVRWALAEHGETV